MVPFVQTFFYFTKTSLCTCCLQILLSHTHGPCSPRQFGSILIPARNEPERPNQDGSQHLPPKVEIICPHNFLMQVFCSSQPECSESQSCSKRQSNTLHRDLTHKAGGKEKYDQQVQVKGFEPHVAHPVHSIRCGRCPCRSSSTRTPSRTQHPLLLGAVNRWSRQAQPRSHRSLSFPSTLLFHLRYLGEHRRAHRLWVKLLPFS